MSEYGYAIDGSSFETQWIERVIAGKRYEFKKILLMKNAVKNKIITNCKKMLDGKLNLILGCRKISSLRLSLDEAESDLFFCIRAVDSETDHYPFGNIREKCDKNYLHRCDEEIEAYLISTKTRILRSCREIIKYLDSTN